MVAENNKKKLRTSPAHPHLADQFLSYIGQLRIYSLVDLIILSFSTHADPVTFWGAILLWVGFLAYLESQHHHGYRSEIPAIVPYLFFLPGLFFYCRIEGIVFVALCYLYTLKNQPKFGASSPFFRGAQSLVLVGGITGFGVFLPWLAGLLTFMRNLLGDFRDIEKDQKEGMRTLPIILKFKKSIPHVHLLGVMGTTLTWWCLAGLPVWVLLGAWVLEIGSYNLTER